MTPEEILRGVEAVAREHLDRHEKLEPAMDLIEDLELDSLLLLTLAVEVENKFRIRLDQEDEAAIRALLVRSSADRATDVSSSVRIHDDGKVIHSPPGSWDSRQDAGGDRGVDGEGSASLQASARRPSANPGEGFDTLPEGPRY